jgi:nitrate/TMAO reductase-like tetraheme cytochrome c subunit
MISHIPLVCRLCAHAWRRLLRAEVQACPECGSFDLELQPAFAEAATRVEERKVQNG